MFSILNLKTFRIKVKKKHLKKLTKCRTPRTNEPESNRQTVRNVGLDIDQTAGCGRKEGGGAKLFIFDRFAYLRREASWCDNTHTNSIPDGPAFG